MWKRKFQKPEQGRVTRFNMLYQHAELAPVLQVERTVSFNKKTRYCRTGPNSAFWEQSVKGEWPMIITTIFMLKLHYNTILAQRRRMEELKLKICHYLKCESHIHLGVLRKANAKSEHNFGCLAEL